MSVRLFEGEKHASLYSKFRPNTPKHVIDVVLNYLSKGIARNKWETACDMGCGTGQNTIILSHFFKYVYGFDVSPAQIQEANKLPHPDNVYFNVSIDLSFLLIYNAYALTIIEVQWRKRHYPK